MTDPAPGSHARAHSEWGGSASCSITPVVLVGGRSRRFGRDKLREPVAAGKGAEADGAADDAWLVDRPIAALRSVFGPRIAAVGECDPRVAARFDRIIADLHPGAGPIGGIISALVAAEDDGGAVFALAGDLAAVTGAEVRAVLDTWWKRTSSEIARQPGCSPAPSVPADGPAPAAGPLAAVMASTDRPEPCCALYLPPALPILRARLGRGQRSVHDAIPSERLAVAPLPRHRLANVNAPADLKSLKDP